MALNVDKFPNHEASKAHIACYLKWENLKYSTQTKERFNSLARLSIESQLSRQLDFKDIISNLSNISNQQKSQTMGFRFILGEVTWNVIKV